MANSINVKVVLCLTRLPIDDMAQPANAPAAPAAELTSVV